MMTEKQSDTLPTFIKQHPDGWVIEIIAAPHAKRSRFVGLHGGVPRIAVAAPPTDGRANEELTLFIAEFLEIPRQSIQLLRGDSSEHKSLLVCGVSRKALSLAFSVKSDT
jgi:uncharacterized protein (TIGR00251 family)